MESKNRDRGEERGDAGGASLSAGGSIPGLSRAAFSLHRPRRVLLPVVIAVPHAGRAYAPDLADNMRDAAATARLEDRHVDAVAREAAAQCGVPLLVAHAPRAMIDLNRDPRDLDLTMFTASDEEKAAMRAEMPRGGAQSARALRGLGLFPRRLPGVGELWRQPMRPAQAHQRIGSIHAPYHEALGAALQELRQVWGEAFLLDLHSMPDLSPRSGIAAPATHVIGDRFGGSCRRELVDAALAVLDGHGVEAAYNRPYAGGYVLDRHGDPRGGISAMQLELARSLYLDSRGELPGDGVSAQAGIVTELIRAVAAAMDDRTAGILQAAE